MEHVGLSRVIQKRENYFQIYVFIIEIVQNRDIVLAHPLHHAAVFVTHCPKIDKKVKQHFQKNFSLK